MNYKNILISFGVVGAGLILYKFLLGIVLPITMFVSLGYVLKVLLKGSESDLVQDYAQKLDRDNEPLSIENVVEIKPIEEKQPVSEKQPVAEEQPVSEEQPVLEEQPVSEEHPLEEEQSVEKAESIEKKKPNKKV